MKSIQVPYLKIVLVLVIMLFSIQAFCDIDKKEIPKLNNAIIFDLFINYELTEKHDNLATISDFCPDMNILDFKRINFSTDIAGENQTCEFNFNDDGTLARLIYNVNNTNYRYEFFYDNKKLMSVSIAGKPKIGFTYDKKGRIATITRLKSSGAFEYNFEYLDEENKAKIKLMVVNGEKRSPSSSNYYVVWNDKIQLLSYCFDRYCSHDFTYSEKGDELTYNFSTSSRDGNLSAWEYTAFDDRGNWVERKSDNTIFKRSIEYK